MLGGGAAAVAAPAAATAAETAVTVGSTAARAAAAAAAAAAAGAAVAAPLIADVVGFVAAQNPAWLQPGLDPSKLSWGAPSAAHCASMAAMPAVQYLCTGAVEGGVRLA